MSLGLIYKNAAHIFDEVEKKTPYLEYPLFQETGIVTSAFSTRLGGVSEGYYSSLNLSFDRGDDPARVLENFKRIGASMGVNRRYGSVEADTYNECTCSYSGR